MLVRTLSAAALALSLVAGAATAQPPASPSATPYEKVIADHGSSIVNIKFILKSDNQEQEEEATGVMIEPTGLVLTSNFSMSGGIQAVLMGMNVNPTNVKVLIGDDTQGVDAKMIARDKDLGLAWLQIEKPADKPYAYLDFAASATPRLGDDMLVLANMGKFFDHAHFVSEAKIAAMTTKPRKLFIPTISLGRAEYGAPAFNTSSKAIGVVTFILPDREELENGGEAALRGITSGNMILPAEDVVAATKRAKDTAAASPAEPAPEAPKAEAPKSDAAPSPK
jgi:hypothetical protein